MAIKLGAVDLERIKIGNSDILKVMLGNEQIWPTETPVLTFSYDSNNAYLSFEEIDKDDAEGMTYYENYQFDSDTGVLEILVSEGGV